MTEPFPSTEDRGVDGACARNDLLSQLPVLLLELVDAGLELVDAGREISARDAKTLLQPGELVLELTDVAVGPFAGHGLDAAHARGDARLGDDLEHAQLARGVDVDAAAELLAEVADADDPDGLPVLLLEDGRGTLADAFLERRHPSRERHVGPDPVVDDLLDAPDLLAGQWGEMGKIEAQAGRRDERAGLLDVVAQHLAQGRVEEVGRGVIVRRRLPPDEIGHGVDAVAFADLAGQDLDGVDDDVGSCVRRVPDQRGELRALERARVPDLAAGFGVEGRLLEDDLAGFVRRAGPPSGARP